MASRKAVTEGTWYSVSIETVGDGWQGHDDDADRLVDALVGHPGGLSFSTSWGGLSGGPGATISIAAPSPVEAAALALAIFEKALAEIGLGPVEVARLDLMTETYLDADLNRPPTEYVGLAEVAEILGVSKQRVSELRRRKDFPHPIAEIAAGPVWDRTWLNRFIEGWERKPGRPRKPAN